MQKYGFSLTLFLPYKVSPILDSVLKIQLSDFSILDLMLGNIATLYPLKAA